ncbi:uncharacterized protein LOC124494398 [Dermatophagoides farinae]|uniref:Uncharacterized protein n=1 Tax=Dermatophagoides farinae TaxID=6954 RepID=A0A922IC96_DERFA|nr:probable serine/threonine-protein kinase DDB_G0282963 [Dermatophagoides farinae]KAH7636801.1 hypothetical protein HUG17_7007 [Dermatophagoides farinae]KAH9528122.1 hypothetical protein DERF_002093 [Dermatophagoides farinae]
MILCLKSVRDGECFCSRYDENRQTMFYCGFFTTIAGFIWFIIGFTIRCAFFAEAFGPSVDAVACGIMVVGLMILVIGLFSTISIVCTSKTNNKTSCVSSSSSNNPHHRNHHHHHGYNRTRHERQQTFDDTTAMAIDIHGQSTPTHYSPRTASFSSGSTNEFNSSSYETSTTTAAISPSTSVSSARNPNRQHYNYKSDIAMIA